MFFPGCSLSLMSQNIALVVSVLPSESNGLDGQKNEGIYYGLLSVTVIKHFPKQLQVEKDLFHLICCGYILSAMESKADFKQEPGDRN